MEINFDVENTDSNTSKLTIAKDRILIKFANGVSDVDQERMKSVAIKAVNDLYHPSMLTRRGKFFHHESDIYTITMYIQTRKSNTVDPKTFTEG